jgi:hypothetical protein
MNIYSDSSIQSWLCSQLSFIIIIIIIKQHINIVFYGDKLSTASATAFSSLFNLSKYKLLHYLGVTIVTTAPNTIAT